MAKKSRARRSGTKSSGAKLSETTSTIKRSLRDAQAVFAQYFESGGKRVKETFDALAEIFEGRHLSDALRVSPARAGRASRSSGRRRAAAVRTKVTSTRKSTGTAGRSGKRAKVRRKSS
jgi:hypothetical protein